MSIQNIAYLLLLSKYFIEIPYTHLSFPESNIKGRLPHEDRILHVAACLFIVNFAGEFH